MRSVGKGISSCWGRGRQGIAWEARNSPGILPSPIFRLLHNRFC